MILNGRVFNPGDLRTLVLFQNPSQTMDAGGAQKPSWQDLESAYVKWINVHGLEAVTSQALKTVKRATVTRRYHAHVTERTSIIYNGERWQVISVDDIANRHEYMELIVELAKGTV